MNNNFHFFYCTHLLHIYFSFLKLSLYLIFITCFTLLMCIIQ
ncbi:hypothetical protein MtrunA17_Chr8g0339341 [Medicago truncatula]|uniref:Transmembrane protein n=1 Tax=Medicago truncatula TaxID=3880 RepID=A0A396GJS8_MEDTR|nr:hypothetical protein MtrunA17_Chr8g0339341 [Medicago truncatula]